MPSQDLESLARIYETDPDKLVRSGDSFVEGPARQWFTLEAFRAWTDRPGGGRSASHTCEIDELNRSVNAWVAPMSPLFPPRVLSAPEWNAAGQLVDFALEGVPISERLFTMTSDDGAHVALGSWTGPYEVGIAPVLPPGRPFRRRMDDAARARETTIELGVASRQTWTLESGSLLHPVPGGVAGHLSWSFRNLLDTLADDPRTRTATLDDEAEITRITIQADIPSLRGQWAFNRQPVPDIAQILTRWLL